MKTIIIFSLLVFTFSNLIAQHELLGEQQLNNANIAYKPEVKVSVNSEGVKFILTDDHKELFLRDPVKFCEQNIDISELIESIDSEDKDRFVVKLRSKKGYIKATYNREGQLLRTFQKFQDKAFPLEMSQKLFHDYNGWTITENNYVANGRGNKVNKEKWRISLRKGSLTKNVNINPIKILEKRIAGN